MKRVPLLYALGLTNASGQTYEIITVVNYDKPNQKSHILLSIYLICSI